MTVEVHEPRALADCSQCLATNLGWLLSQVDHAYACEIASALEPLGLGSRGYCVLAAALGGEFTQSQLAGVIGLDKTTMVVTVDELERRGLAERKLSPTDRRARVIAVTKDGRKVVAEAERIIDSVQAEVLGALPARERSAFVDSLARLATGRLAQSVDCRVPIRRREVS